MAHRVEIPIVREVRADAADVVEAEILTIPVAATSQDQNTTATQLANPPEHPETRATVVTTISEAVQTKVTEVEAIHTVVAITIVVLHTKTV